MVRKFFLFASAIAFFACNQPEAKTETAETPEAPKGVMPSDMAGFTTDYSASFAIGDPAKAGTIMSLWRSWVEGDLSKVKSQFADSVSFYSADGNFVLGPLDSAMATMQAYRDNFSNISAAIHAVFPVKSTDKNDDWVCIWGTEYQTDKSGKLDSVQLQETWRFDKNGKVDLMYQYMQANPKK